MARFLSLWFALFLAWLLFSQELILTSLLWGVVLSALVSIFSWRIFWEGNTLKHGRLLYRIDLIVIYFILLIVQNYQASFSLIWRMLGGKYKSGVVRIKTRIRSPMGRIMLANSITLVPGTITLWLSGRYLYVHCFDLKSRHSVEAGRQIKDTIESVILRVLG